MKLPTIETVKAFAPTIGSAVQVHSFGCWYPGTVTKFGKKNITVAFTTSGGPRTKTFQPGYVAAPGTHIEGRRDQAEPFYEQRCKTNLYMLTYRIAKARKGNVGETEAASIEEAVAVALASGCEQHEIDAACSEEAVAKMLGQV